MHPTCKVQWLSPSVMEFVYRNKVKVSDLNAMVEECKDLMAERAPKVQLVDTLAVTGVPIEIGSILNELLELFQVRGGEMVVMVATDKLNEMLGRSMSFGAGIKMELFDNRRDALTFVSNHVSNYPPSKS